MQKLLLLCCAILFASGAAMAQSDAATGTVSTIADAAPAAASPAQPQVTSHLDLTNWQLAFSYQFNEFNMPQNLGKHSAVPAFTANDNGYDVSFARFLVSWGGLEADVSQGFGGTSTPQIKDSKYLMVVGGPRFAWRGHRVEPWAHVLAGLAHFRYSGTATQYGSNNSVAFIGGLGLDLHLNPRTAFRLYGDYVGTALFSEPQTSWEAGAGIVFDF